MKLLYRFTVCLALVAFGLMGCSEDKPIDNREPNYGYVQFRLFKAASYDEGSRAVRPTLDYLSEAYKVKVTLAYGETTLAQTINLSASDAESAEFGLRSDKLKLLTGRYDVVTFSLYDATDELIYNGAPAGECSVEVREGGLEVVDLTVNVTPRGAVRFSLTKDLSSLEGTRAAEREYTFDEIRRASITVQNKMSNVRTSFDKLQCKFSVHFDESDAEEDGYQISSIVCDTILSLTAGDYRVVSLVAYDASGMVLEVLGNVEGADFSVADNRTTESAIPVALHATDEYIKDYYALREIWESLNGESWYYVGENFPTGSNWDFNKDPDLWGDQPGVELHSNGRVARLDLSDFAFSGDMSPAIGQLTELVELYLGNHNDVNLLTYDPTANEVSLSERRRNRMEHHKEYLSMIHTPTQLSEPCARALAEKGLSIPATSLYADKNEGDIFDLKTGEQRQINLYDTNHGTLNNGLRSLPAEIGRLKKLEIFYVANSEIEALPAEMSELVSCTDLEIYNCPKMTRFPLSIAQMPELVSINISNNAQWSAEEIYAGLDALAKGPSREKIQILYARQNSLEELPASFSQMEKIGLLDLAFNKISKIHPLGKGVAPVQLYLDNNLIEELPRDEEGYFCGYDDIETFSVRFNRLKKVPNIFSSDSRFTMVSVDFSGNLIDGFEGEEDGTYKGVKVNTLTLAANPRLTKYPTALAKSNSTVEYVILRACNVDEIPAGSFTYDNSIFLQSLDLSYNNLTDLPREFHAGNMPYFYGLDLSFNNFSEFPYEPLDCAGLTVFAVRSQRNEKGERCLREWPTGIYQHTGLRGLYLGSNDLRKIDDTISTLCYYLDISDNPNIVFDASDICYAWQVGAYILIYDKWQNITNCDPMLE
ncbi:MAG: DUF4458 domain-containing protein [Rikenellaceae bacterium]|nr:DUF4458 domain-containing protein [Rikenellaceae bacterium]